MAEHDHPLDPWFGERHDEDAIWDNLAPGPAVDEVAERLSSIPKPFLEPSVDLVALAGDVLPDDNLATTAVRRVIAAGGESRAQGAAVALWLFASTDLIGPWSVPLASRNASRAVIALALRVAAVVDPRGWLVDAERREEAARTFLLWCGHLPHGEDTALARAMLDMCDSVRRESALSQALADHAHRMETARKLEAQRAREAAARYTSE